MFTSFLVFLCCILYIIEIHSSITEVIATCVMPIDGNVQLYGFILISLVIFHPKRQKLTEV